MQLWKRRRVLHPLLAATVPQQCQQQGTCPCASAQSAVPQLAIADSCSNAGPLAGPGRRHLILPAVSRHDGNFCLCGEWVCGEGRISEHSWTWSPSVAMPASPTAVPWRAPALDCAGAGVCRVVQGARK